MISTMQVIFQCHTNLLMSINHTFTQMLSISMSDLSALVHQTTALSVEMHYE